MSCISKVRGAEGLHEEHARVGLDQVGNARTDQRIVIGRRHPEPREDGVAIPACRSVGRVDHQNVVAGLDEGAERHGDGGHPGADRDRAIGAIQRHHRLLQREHRRGAVTPVIDLAGLPVVLGPLQRVERRVENGRGVIDRWIDDAEIALGIAAGGRNQCVGLHAWQVTCKGNGDSGGHNGTAARPRQPLRWRLATTRSRSLESLRWPVLAFAIRGASGRDMPVRSRGRSDHRAPHTG